MCSRNAHTRNVVTSLYMLLPALLLCTSLAEAQHRTWVDEFDDPNLPGWRNLGTHSEWTAINGSLRVAIADTEGAELLQFTELRGPYNHLEVSITHVRGFNIGLALGKTCPGLSPRWACYIFRGGRVSADVLAPGSGYAPFRFCGLTSKNPEEGWSAEIEDIKSLVVRFDSGAFQVSVNDKLRAEFADPDFDRLNFIGFAQYGLDDIPETSYVDSFHFSGVLSVEPGEKLATTWAGLRR